MKKTLLLSAMFAITGIANAQWIEQDSYLPAESEGVKSIQIIDANTVWALGYDGSSSTPAPLRDFTRTTDGGTIWNAGTVATGDPDLGTTNLVAVSATTAWVGAVANAGGGGVWKTTNGGSVWTKQNPAGYVSASSFFNVVHFFDANVGLTEGDPVSGAYEVYRTTNGGTSWTAVTGMPAPANSSEYGYNGGNVAAGTSFWFVTNQGFIYRTIDQGVNWTKHTTPITDFGAATASGSLVMSDNNNGIIIGTTGGVSTLYKTANGGTSWSAGTVYTVPYTNTSYVKGTTILVGTGRSGAGTTASPYIFYSGYSLDNGTTWTQIESSTGATSAQKTDIEFLNSTTGWAGGFTDATFAGGIYKYTGPALSISDVIANSVKLVVYPNPANNVLNLKGASINKVVAYDLLGKEVLSQDFSSQDEVSINVSALKTGMYILNVHNDNGAAQTMKFTKE